MNSYLPPDNPAIRPDWPPALLAECHILQRIREKDPSGLEILYERYKNPIYGVILRIVREENMAEEVLQDVFIKIWQQVDRYEPQKGKLFTWIFRIARNMAIDRTRSKDMKTWKCHETLVADWLDHHQHYHDFFQAEALDLERLFRILSPKQQEVMSLIYRQGYTHNETAETTGLPLGTVKTLVRMGLETLRSIVSAESKMEAYYN